MTTPPAPETRRFNCDLPLDVAKTLNDVSFTNGTSKTQVIVDAIRATHPQGK